MSQSYVNEIDEGGEVSDRPKRGGYFHIDRRIWSAVCDLGKINPAVAYLALGAGTGGSNSITKWSAKAVNTWTAMPRLRAKEAIELLHEKGFIERSPTWTRNYPHHRLLSWEQWSQRTEKLTAPQQKVLELISEGVQPSNKQTANNLVERGFLTITDGVYSLHDGKAAATELIWLPNSLVTGAPGYEGPSPVTQLLLSGDVWSLRLLIDLYHVHHLESDSGVLRKYAHSKYDRKKLGEQGLYSIWGFKPNERSITWNGPMLPHRQRPMVDGGAAVWSSIHKLERMGLIAFIPHLFPNALDEAAPIHSLGGPWVTGEVEEQAVRSAAIAAGKAMLQEGQVIQAEAEGFYTILPVPHYMEDVCVVGLLRLRFRPHTAPTAKWYGNLVQQAPEWEKRYSRLKEKAGRASYAEREWEAWGT